MAPLTRRRSLLVGTFLNPFSSSLHHPFHLETLGMSSKNALSTLPEAPEAPELRYVQYDNSREEEFLPQIRQLISKDLSEPYSIYVYRYFLYQWGDLCFMVIPMRNRRILWRLTLFRGSGCSRQTRRCRRLQAGASSRRSPQRLYRHAGNSRGTPRQGDRYEACQRGNRSYASSRCG